MQPLEAIGSGISRTPPAYVLLVTGPAGAGKSAAADLWASRRATDTAHLALDDVRCFVRAGYADPRDGWNARAAHQLELARRGCATLARLYVAAGITCVVDDAIFPDWHEAGYGPWERELGPVSHALIVLLPTFTVVRERNALRQGHKRLPEDMLRTIYDMMRPWREQTRYPVLDSSSWSLAETADQLQAALRELGLE